MMDFLGVFVLCAREVFRGFLGRFCFSTNARCYMQKPLRPCRHPGCQALTSQAYCAKHKPKMIRVESKDWHRMYSDPRWQPLRADQLAREPFCRECRKRGIREYATDVDHIVDHKGDWTLFLDPGNLQSLCHSCHSKKTMFDRHRKAKKS